MKAVLREVTPEELERRRKLGLDHWDEMWEGVLHMTPAPKVEHQRIQIELAAFLLPLVKRRRRGTLAVGINIFNEDSAKDDYRIPDFTFVAAGREGLIHEDGIRGGGPDAVIEIRSPGDESYEKLPFFAALGVREVMVIDRDTKRPEVYRLAGEQYLAVAADREGWVTSETLGIRWRRLEGSPPHLALEDMSEPEERTEI